MIDCLAREHRLRLAIVDVCAAQQSDKVTRSITYLRDGRGCLTLGPLSECHKGTRNARGDWGRRNMGGFTAGGLGGGAIRHPEER